MDGWVDGLFHREHLVDAGIPAEVLAHLLEWKVKVDSRGTCYEHDSLVSATC